MHETLKRDDDVQIGSEKSFGLVFAVVFTAIAMLPLIDGLAVRLWPLGIAACFLFATFFA